MIINTEKPQKIYTKKILLLGKNNHPIICEDPTLKYSRTMYHSLFEVTEELDLFERIQSKYFHVLYKH